jgi:hypothetical protein
MPRALVVRVEGDALPDQLPARGAFAVVAALAQRTKGFVFDAVTDRLERPATFLAHAITEPLGASVYRKDRVPVAYDPSDEGAVRLLTTGLLRFGAPDLRVVSVPRASAQRMARVLGALAEALADGAIASPITIDLAAIERARGATLAGDAGASFAGDAGASFAGDAAASTNAAVTIALESAPAADGDPNPNMLLVRPKSGLSPTDYEALAAQFFGPPPVVADDNPTTPAALAAVRAKTQKRLPELLERFKAMNRDVASLSLQVPILDPDEGASDANPMVEPQKFDFIWIDVSSWDDATVTGTPIDESTVVPGVETGGSITRPRSSFVNYDFKTEDGGHEQPWAPDLLLEGE